MTSKEMVKPMIDKKEFHALEKHDNATLKQIMEGTIYNNYSRAFARSILISRGVLDASNGAGGGGIGKAPEIKQGQGGGGGHHN